MTDRILVIEEDPATVAAVERVAMRLGLRTESLRGTRFLDVAFEIERMGGFRAIVSEAILPNNNGLALFSRLRAFWPHTKLVVVSDGYGNPVFREELFDAARQVGVHHTLDKPLCETLLLSCLETPLAAAA